MLSKSDFPNPTNFAGFLIWQKANMWEKYINSKLKSFDLNQGEFLHLVSLSCLVNQQKEVTQASLSEFIGTTAMNTSKILSKLEKMSLIKRKVGTDSRSKAVEITPKGQAILVSSAKNMSELDQVFFDKDGKNDFIKYLQKLHYPVDNLKPKLSITLHKKSTSYYPLAP